MPLPHPKAMQHHPGFFRIAADFTRIEPTDRTVLKEAEHLRDMLRKITGLALCVNATGRTPCADSKISLSLHKRMPEIRSHPEGFMLRIMPDQIDVRACGRGGLFYGLQALTDMLDCSSGQWRIVCGEVRDWPDCAWRGFMLDPPNGFYPLERVRQILDWMAASRMNTLHIHLTDNALVSIAIPGLRNLNKRVYCSLPNIGHPIWREELEEWEKCSMSVYSFQNIRDIVQYAEARQIQVVPELACPSHAAAILKTFPELMCRTAPDGPKHSECVMCIGNEKTYRVLELLIGRIVPLFPSKYFHIGSDEINAPGIYHQSWERCEVCRAAMRRKGYQTVRELFYDFIRRIHRLLAQRGKRMIMWNDFIDIAKPVPIPRDIIIQFWRIPDKTWPVGPIRGCSFVKFLQAGFSVINSHYPNAYIDGFMRDAKLAQWSPHSNPPVPKALRRRIMGGGMCAWGNHEYYVYTLPQAISFFADRLWNNKPINDLDAYARSLARHLFGPRISPAIIGVFEALGAIIPPLKPQTRAFPLAECPLQKRRVWKINDYRSLQRVISKALNDHRVDNRALLRELQLSMSITMESVSKV